MYNKVILEKPLRHILKLAIFIIVVFVIVFAINLLILRAISVKNYSGQVAEIEGVVENINYDEENNNAEIVINGIKYNANAINRFSEDLHLDDLKNKTVTLYLTQTQVGKTQWVLGIKQEDQVLVDYNKVIEQGREENRNLMIAFGVVTGVLFVAACGVYVWRMRITPTKEYDLAQKYAEFSMTRQPSCPEYKKFFIYLLIYIIVVISCTATIGIVCEYVDNETVHIAVGVSLGGIALLATVGFLSLMPLWLFKKEREFYAKNFPFDFSDVSHIPMRKKYKEQLQTELNNEQVLHPHRYGDGGSGYTVEFSEMGLKFYDFESVDEYDSPTTEDVFGIQDAERDAKCLLCTLDYSTLNFEALPFYRKTHHPLVVVIKSRLNETDLPDALNPTSANENCNDVHIVLDSNLLETLRHFNVPVENLDYILNNKEQLIAENCGRFKKH